MSWLTGWNRRKSKIVNGSTAGSQTNYQMRLTIYKGFGADTTRKLHLMSLIHSSRLKPITVYTPFLCFYIND